MRLKPKLLNAIILGLTMFLSMQTTCAACNPSMAIQQKKVATVGKKRVAISKKRVVKSKKRTYRKASARKYSHRELNAIMRILERKFLSEDKTPALRNVVGFGMGSNSIDVALRWNTKEKQLEFCRQIYNSPAIRFEGKLDPIIDNREGVSTYQGISLKAEKPSYPLGPRKSDSRLPTIVARNLCMAMPIASQPKERMAIGLLCPPIARSRPSVMF